MGDIDFSEQFLNFMLHEKLRKYSGVDITTFFPEFVENMRRTLWLHWERCAMGFVSSPYIAVQGTLFAEEVFRGNHSDANNIFRWDVISLNLPGNMDYKPSEPWVCKLRFNGKGRQPIQNNQFINLNYARTTDSH